MPCTFLRKCRSGLRGSEMCIRDRNLTAEGVTKAAVETVAENASDGVIAPLLYMLIGGAPLALTYNCLLYTSLLMANNPIFLITGTRK